MPIHNSHKRNQGGFITEGVMICFIIVATSVFSVYMALDGWNRLIGTYPSTTTTTTSQYVCGEGGELDETKSICEDTDDGGIEIKDVVDVFCPPLPGLCDHNRKPGGRPPELQP